MLSISPINSFDAFAAGPGCGAALYGPVSDTRVTRRKSPIKDGGYANVARIKRQVGGQLSRVGANAELEYS